MQPRRIDHAYPIETFSHPASFLSIIATCSLRRHPPALSAQAAPDTLFRGALNLRRTEARTLAPESPATKNTSDHAAATNRFHGSGRELRPSLFTPSVRWNCKHSAVQASPVISASARDCLAKHIVGEKCRRTAERRLPSRSSVLGHGPFRAVARVCFANDLREHLVGEKCRRTAERRLPKIGRAHV